MNKAVDRVSSSDSGYVTGDLSLYPDAVDTTDSLYSVSNNAETVLARSVSYTTNYIVVEDASQFPESGLFLMGTEMVYYSSRSSNVFQGLKRGFAGSRRNAWTVGTKISQTVTAEHHNALKDAVINMQKFVGLSVNPDPESLNGVLKSLENKFLSPKPVFRATIRRGAPPLTVKFQNFSTGDTVRYLWDFGDGATSVEEKPVHTYQAEGIYTVKLNVITSLGGQGVITKNNYIEVSNDAKPSYFYVTPTAGTTATTFSFVDQTDGEVASRYWIWGDGDTTTELDPDVHAATHTYSQAGTYDPTLLVVFADQRLVRVMLEESIIVT